MNKDKDKDNLNIWIKKLNMTIFGKIKNLKL